MKLATVTDRQFFKLIAGPEGMLMDIGPFSIRLRSREKAFLSAFKQQYQNFTVLPENSYADFDIEICRPNSIRRWYRSQALFKIEKHTPFQPFPIDHAMPLFEWGLNWCIAQRAHQFLILHAGVVAKQNLALIMPAVPGSGKSTLTAALAEKGWRLFSDEFGLIRTSDGQVVSMPRPIALKNESIGVIENFSKDVCLSSVYPKTRKGRVAYVRPRDSSIDEMKTPATPTFIIFPKFKNEAKLDFIALDKSDAFMKTAMNAFNYEVQGLSGYQAIRKIVSHCDCYDLVYSDLEEAIRLLNRLVKEKCQNA